MLSRQKDENNVFKDKEDRDNIIKDDKVEEEAATQLRFKQAQPTIKD